MHTDQGLITAYILDGKGGGREVGWSGVRQWTEDSGTIWVHLDYSDAAAQRWVREDSGLDEVTCEALLAEETRPRSAVNQDGMLVVLRGVNMNPGSDPEDMVSIRIWIEEKRIISSRRRRLLSIDDLRGAIARGAGPATAGEFLVYVSDRLVARMADVIGDIDDAVDQLEAEVLTTESHQLRASLASVRRQVIALRRYLAPQREAMTRLQHEKVPWLDDGDRVRLREIADRITRYMEDLDAARDRAAVTHEELASRLSEQMNRRMYLLSMVAAVFLPLGFLTGLLGINVAGIPGEKYPWAFEIVVLMLIGVIGLQIWIFKRWKWL